VNICRLLQTSNCPVNCACKCAQTVWNFDGWIY